jgi:hypothetical protein
MPILHKGQVQLGNPLRALLCVGIAYFLIGVLVPVITLSAQGGRMVLPAAPSRLGWEGRWEPWELFVLFGLSEQGVCRRT